MGGVLLDNGTDLKAVTGIDDHSRFVVCVGLVERATSRAVCSVLVQALATHGVPEQILTDNGKVFTGRYAHRPMEVLFDKICRENGIRHLLTPEPLRSRRSTRSSASTTPTDRTSRSGTAPRPNASSREDQTPAPRSTTPP